MEGKFFWESSPLVNQSVEEKEESQEFTPMCLIKWTGSKEILTLAQILLDLLLLVKQIMEESHVCSHSASETKFLMAAQQSLMTLAKLGAPQRLSMENM